MKCEPLAFGDARACSYHWDGFYKKRLKSEEGKKSWSCIGNSEGVIILR